MGAGIVGLGWFCCVRFKGYPLPVYPEIMVTWFYRISWQILWRYLVMGREDWKMEGEG